MYIPYIHIEIKSLISDKDFKKKTSSIAHYTELSVCDKRLPDTIKKKRKMFF